MNHFFAYLSRMRFIRRWGLMRNTQPENIQEHSLQTAMIAHALAVIQNQLYDGNVDPERTALLAIYHEAGEVITGDLATPIKNFTPEIKTAFKDIEKAAHERLFRMIPEKLQPDYKPLLFPVEADHEEWRLVKAADKLSAYLKCVEELKAGNQEFQKAADRIRAEIEEMKLPAVEYFMREFTPSFSLSLDELN